jgi:hypothetical protein
MYCSISDVIRLFKSARYDYYAPEFDLNSVGEMRIRVSFLICETPFWGSVIIFFSRPSKGRQESSNHLFTTVCAQNNITLVFFLAVCANFVMRIQHTV